MAELRHSGERGRGASGSSPVKREDAAAATPFLPSSVATSDHDLDRDKDPHRTTSAFILRLPPPLRSLLSLEDPRSPSASFSYRILIAFLSFTFFVLLLSIPSIWKHLSEPYICKKEGITLQCPPTKEPPSLWENPHAAATSWKPCAERRPNEISGNFSCFTGFLIITDFVFVPNCS